MVYWLSSNETLGFEELSENWQKPKNPNTISNTETFYEDLTECQKEIRLAQEQFQQETFYDTQMEIEAFINNWENECNGCICRNESDTLNLFLVTKQEISMAHVGSLQQEQLSDFALDLQKDFNNLEFEQELKLDLEMQDPQDFIVNSVALTQQKNDIESWELILNQHLEHNNQLNLFDAPSQQELIQPQVLKTHNNLNYTIKVPDPSSSGGGANNSGGFGGFGDGGNNSEFPFNENDPKRLGLVIFFYIVLLFVLRFCLVWCFKQLEKVLRALTESLNTLVQKNRHAPHLRLYRRFWQLLLFIMSLLAGPDVLNLMLRTFPSGWFRSFLRGLHTLLRFGLLLGLFFGGNFYGLNLYKRIMQFISPILEKTMSFLSGPQNITRTQLFLEKCIKTVGLCVIGGYFCVCIQQLTKQIQISNVRNKWQKILIRISWVGLLCFCVYFISTDFYFIRGFVKQITAHPIVGTLLNCQLGRLSILLGMSWFMLYFSYLPGISVFYILCIYGLGVYSLAFSASPNLFPIN